MFVKLWAQKRDLTGITFLTSFPLPSLTRQLHFFKADVGEHLKPPQTDSQNVLRGKGIKEQLVETFSFTNSKRALSGMFLKNILWRCEGIMTKFFPSFQTVKNTSHRQNFNSKGHRSLAGFPMSHEIYKSVSSTNYPRQQSKNSHNFLLACVFLEMHKQS